MRIQNHLLKKFLLALACGSISFLHTNQNRLHAQATEQSAAVDAYLKELFEEYHQRRLALFPLDATLQGDSRFNDQLAITPSPDHVLRRKSFYTEIAKKLEQTPPGIASPENALATAILKYELENQLEAFQFDVERIPCHQFDGLPLTFAQLGSGSSSQPFKNVKDYENWLQRIKAYSAWTNAAIDAFRRGAKDGYVLPKILVTRMIEQQMSPTIVTATPEESLFYAPIRNIPKEFSETDRTRLTEAYRLAISDELIPAYKKLGEFLRDEYLPKCRDSSGIGSLPGGKEQYAYWVKTWTTTDLTPDEIFDIGEKEVTRILSEMEKVQTELAIPGTLQEFFAVVKTDPRFTPYQSADEVINAFRLIQGKIEPNLDDIFLNRPKTKFEIRRTEAFREQTASAEYMPGSADGSRPGIFYLPIPEPAKFNVTSGMESLFLHEAIPGHHYQVSLQQESEKLPKFLRFLWVGSYGEGWALYCESMGKELGLYQDPKQYLGALGDEMHRAIRLVVDVGIHHKGWTREQAIEYMMSKEPISEQSAVAEIERYMAMPGQALAYKIGALKIRELRTKYERELGSKFKLSSFHDEILKDGCMPLSILEAKLAVWATKQ